MVFTGTLGFNLVRAPAKIYAEQQAIIADLQARLDRNAAAKAAYDYANPLYTEGEKLLFTIPRIGSGALVWDHWTDRVDDWREKTREALPYEKDSFLADMYARTFQSNAC